MRSRKKRKEGIASEVQRPAYASTSGSVKINVLPTPTSLKPDELTGVFEPMRDPDYFAKAMDAIRGRCHGPD